MLIISPTKCHLSIKMWVPVPFVWKISTLENGTWLYMSILNIIPASDPVRWRWTRLHMSFLNILSLRSCQTKMNQILHAYSQHPQLEILLDEDELDFTCPFLTSSGWDPVRRRWWWGGSCHDPWWNQADSTQQDGVPDLVSGGNFPGRPCAASQRVGHELPDPRKGGCLWLSVPVYNLTIFSF